MYAWITPATTYIGTKVPAFRSMDELALNSMSKIQ